MYSKRIKKVMFVLLFFVLAFSFFACYDDPKESCQRNSDCSKDKACYDGYCFEDFCKNNHVDCGAGRCIGGTNRTYASGASDDYGNEYYCECDSGASLQKVNFEYTCVSGSSGGSSGGTNGSCTYNSECGSTYTCYMGSCKKKCNYDGECQSGYRCSNFNVCVVDTGGSTGGSSNECNYDSNCASGYFCNTYKKCEKIQSVGAGGSCGQNKPCISGYTCSFSICKKECTSDAQCSNGYACNFFKVCDKTCTSDADCSDGKTCALNNFCY